MAQIDSLFYSSESWVPIVNKKFKILTFSHFYSSYGVFYASGWLSVCPSGLFFLNGMVRQEGGMIHVN